MRTRARFHVLAVLALCLFVLVIRYGSSSRSQARLQEPGQRRLVVFGDFHSDSTGAWTSDSNPQSGNNRDAAQGLPWTHLLGNEVRLQLSDRLYSLMAPSFSSTASITLHGLILSVRTVLRQQL